MGARRRGRELALQALYALDMGERSESSLHLFWESFAEEPEVQRFADDLVRGVLASREELDREIAARSRNWTLARMARVDLNLLRLGAYELLHRPDIPKNVTINEAVEVAKLFGSEDSAAFVNGILDDLAASLPDKG